MGNTRMVIDQPSKILKTRVKHDREGCNSRVKEMWQPQFKLVFSRTKKLRAEEETRGEILAPVKLMRVLPWTSGGSELQPYSTDEALCTPLSRNFLSLGTPQTHPSFIDVIPIRLFRGNDFCSCFNLWAHTELCFYHIPLGVLTLLLDLPPYGVSLFKKVNLHQCLLPFQCSGGTNLAVSWFQKMYNGIKMALVAQKMDIHST